MVMITFFSFLKLIKVFSPIIPVRKNRVCLVCRDGSGDNVRPVYDALRKSAEGLEIELIEEKQSRYKTRIEKITQRFSDLLNITSSKIIITTHGPIYKTHRNITIELWHGFPTKKSCLLLNDRAYKRFANVDHFICTTRFLS